MGRNCNSATGKGRGLLLALRQPPRLPPAPEGIGVLDTPARIHAQREGIAEDLAHPAVVYLASISARSRKTQLDSMRIVARRLGFERVGDVNWPALGRSPMRLAFLHAALRATTPSTGNKCLYVTRSLLLACVRLRQLTRDEYEIARDVLQAFPGQRQRAARYIERDELEKLFAAAQRPHDAGPAYTARDVALLAILFGGGLRRDEASTLDLSSWDGRAGTLRFIGKGNKERTVPMPPAACRAIDDWLKHRGRAAGPLLLAMTRYGWRPTAARLTEAGVYACVKRLAEAAGLASVSPHCFRATYISEMLDIADAITVAQLAGHANVSTTMGYDRRPERSRAEAVGKLRVPYSPDE